MTNLWCYIEGNGDIFGVSIPPDHKVDDLKKAIYNASEAPSCFVGYDHVHLTLTKVRCHDLYVNINVTNGLCLPITSAGQC
jgi:hypothetical protein